MMISRPRLISALLLLASAACDAPPQTSSELGSLARSLTPTVTKRSTAIVLVNFEDKLNVYTPAQVRTDIYTGPNSVNAYFYEQSYGFFQLGGIINPQGDVFGPVTIPARSDGNCDPVRWEQLATTAVFNLNGDRLRDWKSVVYYMPQTNCPWSVSNSNFQSANNGNFSLCNGVACGYSTPPAVNFVAQAIGFHIGLGGAATASCVNGAGVRVTVSETCTIANQADPFDVMANRSWRHLSALNKARAGWLADANVATVNTSGTYTLTPLERVSNGVQSLRIPLGVVDGVAVYYYLDFRQAFGTWDNYGATSSTVNGVQIRLGSDYGDFADDTVLLDATPASPSFDDASLPVGATFSDGDITITTSSASTLEAKVVISVPVEPEPTPPPTPRAGRPVLTVDAGSPLTGTGSPDAGQPTQQPTLQPESPTPAPKSGCAAAGGAGLDGAWLLVLGGSIALLGSRRALKKMNR
jgi:hypothetical protein